MYLGVLAPWAFFYSRFLCSLTYQLVVLRSRHTHTVAQTHTGSCKTTPQVNKWYLGAIKSFLFIVWLSLLLCLRPKKKKKNGSEEKWPLKAQENMRRHKHNTHIHPHAHTHTHTHTHLSRLQQIHDMHRWWPACSLSVCMCLRTEGPDRLLGPRCPVEGQSLFFLLLLLLFSSSRSVKTPS